MTTINVSTISNTTSIKHPESPSSLGKDAPKDAPNGQIRDFMVDHISVPVQPNVPMHDFTGSSKSTGFSDSDMQSLLWSLTHGGTPSGSSASGYSIPGGLGGKGGSGGTPGGAGIDHGGSTASKGFSNWSFHVTSTQSQYLKDPSQNPQASQGCSWQANTNVDLYPTGGVPSPIDIDQHTMPDCGLVSTLASWAAQEPAAIQNTIKPTGSTTSDGSPIYDVQMYDPNGNPVTIAVNADSEVTNDGNQVQTTGPNGFTPNWATITEKAYAKYRDVYGGPNGNVPAGQMKGMAMMGGIDQIDAMEAFTGVAGAWTASSSPSLFSNIGNGLHNHEMIVANCPNDFTLSGHSFPGGHSYTVESLDSANSTVTVRNPWGTGNDSTYSDGMITMSYADFQKYFAGVDIGQASVTGSTNADVHQNTLDALEKNGGGMALSEGAGAGKANQALTDQAVAAIKAGDLTSFNDACLAITKAMNGSHKGSNDQVIVELETLSLDTIWKSDAGSSVIAENVQHAADALAAGDWQSSANPSDIQRFIGDFNNGASIDVLNNDQQAIAGDLRDTDLSGNLSAIIKEAMTYASSHSADFGKAPDSSTQQSLIDAFNQAAAAAGADSFTSNITDGWNHIQNDMSANNTSHLQQDLRWMLGHISDAGNYNDKEQPVVDAINNIAKAWGITLSEPSAPPPQPILVLR